MGALTKGGLNFGRNLALDVIIGGVPFPINNLLTVAGRRPMQTLHTELPINNDGVAVRDVTYEGIEVTLRLTRQNGQIDALFFALYNNFKLGGPKPDVTLTETIVNPNGSADRHIYSDGVIEIKNLGTFQHNDAVNDVEITITFSDGQDVGGATLPNLNTQVALL